MTAAPVATNSWKFLEEIFCDEIKQYITEDINSRIKAQKYLGSISRAGDLVRVLADMCREPEESFTYQKFLEHFVGPYDTDGGIPDPEGRLLLLENRFIGYFNNILLNNRRSRRTRSFLGNVELLFDTYALWLSTGVAWKDWFILSEWAIENRKKVIWGDYKSTSRKAFSSWSHIDSWSVSIMPSRHKEVILHVMCLFIMLLRYEHVLSQDIRNCLLTMYDGRYPAGASKGGRYLMAEVLKINPIVSQEDRDRFESKDESDFFYRPENIPGWSFLPFMHKKVSSIESLKFCMERFSESYDKARVESLTVFRDVEMRLNPPDWRLLVDYEFPYTSVRWNDTFLPIKNVSAEDASAINLVHKLYVNIMFDHLLKERIYKEESTISGLPEEQKEARLRKLETARIRWSVHAKKRFFDKVPDGGRFDYIQVLPNVANEQAIVHRYNSYLKTNGKFLAVVSKEEIAAERKVEQTFEQFRHGLKFRDSIPTAAQHLFENLPEESDLREKAFSIHFLSNVLNSQISTFANPSIKEKKDVFSLADVINEYVRSVKEIHPGIVYSTDITTRKEGGAFVEFNKPLMIVLIHTIVDNAEQHGFKNYDIDKKKIHFALESIRINNPEVNEEGDYLCLSICNNGRPFDSGFTLSRYKTNHAFSGPSGHTGIGGYQVNRIAVTHGGFINISRTDEWNTIIEIYLQPYGKQSL